MMTMISQTLDMIWVEGFFYSHELYLAHYCTFTNKVPVNFFCMFRNGIVIIIFIISVGTNAEIFKNNK